MTPDQVEAHFTGSGGDYKFARWGRPIVPVVFGVEDETLVVVKGAIEAVVTMADHKMAELDPEIGANLMMFFFRDWDEVMEVPNLHRMIPDLADVVGRLKQADANQYRAFRFDDDGGIQACFVFICMDDVMAELPVETIALTQALQAILVWSHTAFAEQSPLVALPDSGETVLRADIAALVRAGYGHTMPVSANDKSHALRMFARIQTA